MEFSAIFWVEIGTAIVIAITVLWTKPEYGVFLYAFALGFPDIALPLGDAINVRVDDVLVGLLLVRTVLCLPKFLGY